MKVAVVTLTLAELQQALLDYCEKQGHAQPDEVEIRSHGRCISVELRPGGLVEAEEFAHRADQEQTS